MRQFSFPPVVTDTKVKSTIDNYLQRADELSAANRAVVELEGRRDAVVEEDRRQLAEAIKANNDEAPPVALRAFEKQLAEAQRRCDALELLVAQAEAELLQVVEDRRSAWGADVDRSIEKSRGAAAKAVTALEAAVAELTGLLVTKIWLDGFPARTMLATPMATSRVAGLVGPNHEPIAWASVAAALRQFVEPPVPVKRPPVLHVIPKAG